MYKRTSLKITSGKKQGKGIITIKNMKVEKPYRVYDVKCDRSSPLGNPVGLRGDESKRDWACEYYASWFKNEVLTKNNWEAYEELMRLRALYREHRQLRIFCWCSPKRCHTETIVQWLKENEQ